MVYCLHLMVYHFQHILQLCINTLACYNDNGRALMNNSLAVRVGVTVNTVARKFCRGDEISLGNSVASKSQRHFFLGNFAAARKFCRSYNL